MATKIERYDGIVSSNYYIKESMSELGITKQYTAYYFLVDILDILINESRIVRSFYKEVYPIVAKKYHKNDCSIERDIRNMIKVTWDIRLKNKLSQFWNKERRPSCCEFIYLVKNYLIMQIA